MNDQDPATDATTAKPAKKTAKPAEDTRTAKVLTRATVRLRGFTLGKGQTVDRVPLAHAEYLAARGEVEILEVS